jgi:hypothetical protein
VYTEGIRKPLEINRKAENPQKGSAEKCEAKEVL